MDRKTIIECCAQIAKVLFIDKSDSKWAAVDIKKLRDVVKN